MNRWCDSQQSFFFWCCHTSHLRMIRRFLIVVVLGVSTRFSSLHEDVALASYFTYSHTTPSPSDAVILTLPILSSLLASNETSSVVNVQESSLNGFYTLEGKNTSADTSANPHPSASSTLSPKTIYGCLRHATTSPKCWIKIGSRLDQDWIKIESRLDQDWIKIGSRLDQDWISTISIED